jgi:protein-ribulosamine 3-kinase
MSLWQHVEQDISAHLGRAFHITDRHSIGGGSINNAYRVSDGRNSYFVKTNRARLLYMFEAEQQGLAAIVACGCVKVPEPISTGVSGHEAYFIMSWLAMQGQPKAESFARQLADMHRCTAERFGFDIDNTIGSTPQVNSWHGDWIEFWRKQRLGYQLELAWRNGYRGRLYDMGMQLVDKTPLFFEGYRPRPSLLHGDLWGGNWAGDERGEPVIFDPACYYGDREADLAMMELFGHPGQRFFDIYHEHYPIDAGYRLRRNFYNLYHILNHANMFGSSYAMQAENMLEGLLAAVRA